MARLPKRRVTLLDMWSEAATAPIAAVLPAATLPVLPAATPPVLPAAIPPVLLAAPTEIIVGGVSLVFPFPPYPSQICIANQMIRAFKLKKHALLESPTGTGDCLKGLSLLSSTDSLPSGKSLAILISSIAWLQCQKALVEGDDDDDVMMMKRVRDPSPFLCSGIGMEDKEDIFEPDKVFRASTAAVVQLPRIYICSRTHAQLSQLIKGLKSTKYTPSMAVLGSREQMCIHPSVMLSETKNEDCSKLIGGGDSSGCSFFQAANVMANHSSMRVVWDIEDIVTKGRQFRACPYFTAMDIAHRSDVVFCPYNFVIDKLIRESSGIDLKNNIVIFDEAHNLEDQCREAASFSVTVSLITAVIEMLGNCKNFPNCPAAVAELMVALSLIPYWIKDSAKAMRNEGSGEMILEFVAEQVPFQFNKMGLTRNTVKELATKAAKVQDWHKEIIELSEAPDAFRWVCPTDGKTHTAVPAFTVSMRNIQMILLVTGYAHEFEIDYAICLQQKHMETEVKVHIWCLNPAIAFKDLREQCRSVVLISGASSTVELKTCNRG
jgi:Rad3-related DNA helicase